MEKKKTNKVSAYLDGLDGKIESKGKVHKNIWQFFKFSFVSCIITLIQLALLYSMYYLMKNWKEPLPGFLATIFSKEIVGVDHDNWGYMLPFFLSNFIANTVGYFLNKRRTFKSDSPIWHYVIYIVVLIILITFSTWLQGILTNVFIQWGVEVIGPFIAMSIASFIQFIVLFPLQKFVLLREKKKEPDVQQIE